MQNGCYADTYHGVLASQIFCSLGYHKFFWATKIHLAWWCF